MKVKVEIQGAFETMPGYRRIGVHWRNGKMRHTVFSGIFSDNAPISEVALVLHRLSDDLLRANARHPLSK